MRGRATDGSTGPTRYVLRVAVLVVDDSEAVRARLVALIGEAVPAGIEVHGAENVRAALAVLETVKPKAVILDFHLLGEDGLEVLDRVKARTPATLLVVLTNEPSDYHRRACEQRGADYFFDKSHDFERAIEVVVARLRATWKS